MASQILNLDQWREHVLDRLARQVRASGDRGLAALYRELLGYPGGTTVDSGDAGSAAADVIVPLRLRRKGRVVSLFSTVTTFGTPRDITVEELAIEAFYPADVQTSQLLRSM